MSLLGKVFSKPAQLLGRPVALLRRALDDLIVKHGALELNLEIQQAMTAMILASAGRWIYFILVIITAHAMGQALHGNVPIFVAFGILFGIYGYYVLMTIRIADFCLKIWRHNGFIGNPASWLYLYIYDAVVAEVSSNKFARYFSCLFFPGHSQGHIRELARDIIKAGTTSRNLWIFVGVRLLLYCVGWIIYLLCYESIFLFATGIDFSNWYEPIIWPLVTVGKFLLQKMQF